MLALLQYFQHQQETDVDIISMAASLQCNFIIFVFLMLLFKVLHFKICGCYFQMQKPKIILRLNFQWSLR